MSRRLAKSLAVLAAAMALVGAASPAASAGYGSGNATPYPETIRTEFLRDCMVSASAARCECMYRRIQADLTLAEYQAVDTVSRQGAFESHPYRARLAEHGQVCAAQNPA